MTVAASRGCGRRREGPDDVEEIMRRMQPTTEGAWCRAGRKHYRHESGVEVVYRPNAWLWEIVGGRYDGHRFDRLWAAQHHAVQGG